MEAALTEKHWTVIEAQMKSSNIFVAEKAPLSLIRIVFIVTSCITVDHKHAISMVQKQSPRRSSSV
jgi:hypothetical protein